jgi:hypothetical protein
VAVLNLLYDVVLVSNFSNNIGVIFPVNVDAAWLGNGVTGGGTVTINDTIWEGSCREHKS